MLFFLFLLLQAFDLWSFAEVGLELLQGPLMRASKHLQNLPLGLFDLLWAHRVNLLHVFLCDGLVTDPDLAQLACFRDDSILSDFFDLLLVRFVNLERLRK